MIARRVPDPEKPGSIFYEYSIDENQQAATRALNAGGRRTVTKAVGLRRHATSALTTHENLAIPSYTQASNWFISDPYDKPPESHTLPAAYFP